MGNPILRAYVFARSEQQLHRAMKPSFGMTEIIIVSV